MPRTKEQCQQLRYATNDRIVTAALSLFAEKGYAATSMQEVAARAGMSAGSIYRHYNSKEDLFNELMLQAAAGLKRSTDLFESGGSPRSMFLHVATEICDQLAHNEDFSRFLILLNQSYFYRNTFSKASSVIRQNQKIISACANVIRQGQETDHFKRGIPEEMATQFFASILGLGLMKYAMPFSITIPSPTTLTGALFDE